MNYLKSNFQAITFVLKNTFTKIMLLTSAYLFLTYLIGIVSIHFFSGLEVPDTIQPAMAAFLKYTFSLILPISAFMLLFKYQENNQFLKNLPYVFNPLIKFELILYILFATFFILISSSIFIKVNPILSETGLIWMDTMKSTGYTDVSAVFKHLETNTPEVIDNLMLHFSSIYFNLSVVLLIFLIVICLTFFTNVIQILINKNLGFFANIKASYKIFKSKIISIIFFISLSFSLLLLADSGTETNMFYIYLIIFFKSFIFSIFANSLVLISEYRTPTTAESSSSSNDDVYNVEIKD